MSLIRKISLKIFSLSELLLLSFVNIFQRKRKFEIKPSYKHRIFYFAFDDCNNTDHHQNEVYQFAFDFFTKKNYKSVLDFGCGSGYKLMKYFKEFDTTGIEVEKTLRFLKSKYPDRKWISSDLLIPPKEEFDLLVCSDVIEHFKNPEMLLDYFKKINFKHLVISSPERNTLASRPGGRPNGPPRNIYHLREWSKDEFNRYISQHFDILEHVCEGENQIVLGVK